MSRLLPVTALALLLASPALAGDPTSSGSFADVVARGLYETRTTAPLPTGVGAITVGKLTVEMEATPLVDIAAAFGGDVTFEGEAGEAMDWVCDGAGQATIWFMSDGEMGDGKLTIFAVEAKAPRIDWNCGTLPADISIDAGMPGLGALAADVRAKVGGAEAGADGRFVYSGEAPSKTEQGFVIYQDVVYEERDGKIVAFGINQLSEG